MINFTCADTGRKDSGLAVLNFVEYTTWEEMKNAYYVLTGEELTGALHIFWSDDRPSWMTRKKTSFEETSWIIDESNFELLREEYTQTPEITVDRYSDKSLVVRGKDTKALKETLKSLGGKFNAKLSGGPGWIFSNRAVDALFELQETGDVSELAREYAAAHPKLPAGGSNMVEQFRAWLAEFYGGVKNDYVGAIKMRGQFFILPSPKHTAVCENFYFSEYEWNMERPKLEESKKYKEDYFLKSNLAAFDDVYYLDDLVNQEYAGTWAAITYANDDRVIVLRHSADDGMTPASSFRLSNDEVNLVIEGLKFARGEYEKRLRAYLKRYGVDKLRFYPVSENDD